MAPDPETDPKENVRQQNGKKKNDTLLYAAVAAIVVLVVVGAIAGYLYFDGQRKQEDARREALRQAFLDQQNETARQYALINGYPAPGNKNYVDDFQVWAGGFRKLANNYSQAVALLAADGAAYLAKLENGTGEYLNVTRACTAANDSAKTVNASAATYENEVWVRRGMMDNASTAYELALNRSCGFYNTAWDLMMHSDDYKKYGGYLKYLEACVANNTYYRDSIGLVLSTGATYQAYLKDSGYYAINTTILGLQDNTTRLERRYVDLQKWKPELVLTQMDINTAWSADKGFYKAVNFVIDNYNRRNNTEPMKVWNVVVHYSLVDLATGRVRSSSDVSVAVTDYWRSDVNCAILPCEDNGNYRYDYTVTFEY